MPRHALPALLLATGLAAAQTGPTMVVPSQYGATRGNSYNSYPFSSTYNTYHGQWIYDANDLTVPAGQMRGLALRRANAVSNTSDACTADVEVGLAVGTMTPAAVSSLFSANVAMMITVFPKTTVNLPKADNQGGTAPWSVAIPFVTLFPYARHLGPSLVVDVKVTNSVYPAGSWWYLDAVKADSGKWAYLLASFPNSACMFSNGTVSKSGGYLDATLVPGGRFRYAPAPTGGLPAGLNGLVFLGANGPGMVWAGIGLPLSLGFLGAGTCQLGVSLEMVMPTAQDPTTGRYYWPWVNIPGTPEVVGATVYEQAIYIDPPANAAGLVTSNVVSWTIGSGIPPAAAEVYVTKDTYPPAALNGTVRREAPVVQFQF